MRTGRVAEPQNSRFSNYRRIRIPGRSRIPHHRGESLPFLVLSRLSLIRTVPVAEFYVTEGQRYLRLRFFDCWSNSFEPTTYIFEVPSLVPADNIIEPDSTTR